MPPDEYDHYTLYHEAMDQLELMLLEEACN